jgi:AcrR family transcriptional regulator
MPRRPSSRPAADDRTKLKSPGRAGTPAEGRELRARGQRTMRKLLDAGVEVFGKRGYHPARVDDIVKVAKTSHGTFYLYFSNKEDLFRALALDVADEMNALAASLGEIGPTPEGYAELRRWLEEFAVLHAHYGPVIRAWTEAEIDTSAMGGIGADVLAGFAAAITERVRTIPSVAASPEAAALALVAMIERFNYYVLSRQVAADRAAAIDTVAEVAYAALFGPRPRDRSTT